MDVQQKLEEQADDIRIFRRLLIGLTHEFPIIVQGDIIHCGYCHGVYQRGNPLSEKIHLPNCVWLEANKVLTAMNFVKNEKEQKWWNGVVENKSVKQI